MFLVIQEAFSLVILHSYKKIKIRVLLQISIIMKYIAGDTRDYDHTRKDCLPLYKTKGISTNKIDIMHLILYFA